MGMLILRDIERGKQESHCLPSPLVVTREQKLTDGIKTLMLSAHRSALLIGWKNRHEWNHFRLHKREERERL